MHYEGRKGKGSRLHGKFAVRYCKRRALNDAQLGLKLLNVLKTLFLMSMPCQTEHSTTAAASCNYLTGSDSCTPVDASISPIFSATRSINAETAGGRWRRLGYSTFSAEPMR